MKKLIFIFFLFSAIAATAQVPTWSPVVGRWQYQYFRVDSNLRLPRDTVRLTIADTGSMATKGQCLYTFQKRAGVLKWVITACAAQGPYPTDISYDIPAINLVDTSFTDPSGYHITCYTWVSCPEFIGYRVRVTWPGFGELMPDDALGAGWWYHYDSVTGIFRLYSGNGCSHGFILMGAY